MPHKPITPAREKENSGRGDIGFTARKSPILAGVLPTATGREKPWGIRISAWVKPTRRPILAIRVVSGVESADRISS
jgi:hypothetical protein